MLNRGFQELLRHDPGLTHEVFYLVRRPCSTPKSETQGMRLCLLQKEADNRQITVLIAERLHCGTAHGASGSSSAEQRTS